MTRIIAGFARSTSLGVPKAGTRPTSERVREALFSALEARDEIRGLRVADLYAGTGALGLEAASRGATHVTLVEKAPQAARAARENARLVSAKAPTGAAPTIDIVSTAVRPYLQHGTPSSLDVVFLDPPYDQDDDELKGDLVALLPLLDDDALVVIERTTRSGEPLWPDGLTLETSRSYGDTVLWWGRA